MSPEFDNHEQVRQAEFTMRKQYRDYLLENGYVDPNFEGTDDIRNVGMTAIFFDMMSAYSRQVLPAGTDEHTTACYIKDVTGAYNSEDRTLEVNLFSRISHVELALHYFSLRLDENIALMRERYADRESSPPDHYA